MLISWELPGFAFCHIDEGCSIERLYRGIKKGVEIARRQKLFSSQSVPRFGSCGQDANIALISRSALVPVWRAAMTKALTPAYTLAMLHLDSLWTTECWEWCRIIIRLDLHAIGLSGYAATVPPRSVHRLLLNMVGIIRFNLITRARSYSAFYSTWKTSGSKCSILFTPTILSLFFIFFY